VHQTLKLIADRRVRGRSAKYEALHQTDGSEPGFSALLSKMAMDIAMPRFHHVGVLAIDPMDNRVI